MRLGSKLHRNDLLTRAHGEGNTGGRWEGRGQAQARLGQPCHVEGEGGRPGLERAFRSPAGDALSLPFLSILKFKHVTRVG